MSTNKKYYYLKLKDNFFDRSEIKILEQMEGGYIYSNLYLKLCLMSLKGEGRLLFRDEIPYDEQMISSVTGVPLDNVRAGLVMLQKIGLIIRVESGEIYMTDIQDMIGHTSSEGERKRLYREKIKQIADGTMSQDVPKNVHQRLEIRDKRLEIKYNICAQEKETKKKQRPTISEISDYCKERNNSVDPEKFFDYYEANGWKVGKNPMKDWKAAVRTWERNNFKSDKPVKKSGEQIMAEYEEEKRRRYGNDSK